MDAGSHSPSSVLQDFALRISVEWLVRILLLISMMLQLVLVVLGPRRYYCSSGIFRFMVWGAYISADAVAISALATMMHNARSGIYGIWAPVLLLHLGGPDAITAYSMADNELWLRHGFNMVYQVSVAVYVMYSSALEGHALASAILLLVAGAIKYGERTMALWLGTYSQIVKSCLPISKYIKEGNVVRQRGYVVMGEKQLQSMTEKVLGESSTEGRDIEAGPQAPSLEGREIEAGPQAPSLEGREIEAGPQAPSLEGREIVTIEDVKSANIIEAGPEGPSMKGRDIEAGLEAPSTKGRDIEAGPGVVTVNDLRRGLYWKEESDYNLCLSHALFKMYKRRFASLYFDEGNWPETRDFWFERKGMEAFRIVEMELKFMYDALFSKWSGAAFGKWGVVVRLLNTTLMGVAGFLILKEREHKEAQRTVTYVVISVALVVEVFQLCRIMISDWTRVHLICAERLLWQSDLKWWYKTCRLKVIEIALLVLGKVQNVVGGDRHRSSGIHQHCLMETCLNRTHFVWKMAEFFSKGNSFVVSGYIKLWHIHKVSVRDELKEFIFDILRVKCGWSNSVTRTESIYGLVGDVFKIVGSKELEEVILKLHIATTICDRERSLQSIENENVRLSRILSRYCAYLLLSHPNLLPLHPDMARTAYMQLVERLLKIHDKNMEVKTALGAAARIVREFEDKEEEERWKLLAEYWGRLVIYMAVYNKATLHAECLAGGGEFLSQVWVLLGHMGYGEQSDSAVSLKVEAPKETLERQHMEGAEKRLERERVERERVERARERVERARARLGWKRLRDGRVRLQKKIRKWI